MYIYFTGYSKSILVTLDLHLSRISLSIKFSERSIHTKLPDKDSDDNDNDRQAPASEDVEDQWLSTIGKTHEVDPESNSLGGD